MVDNILPKSQRQIRKAFLNILKNKSFHQITVKDITSEAELGRSTFYLYYNDKYGLLEEIEDELINGFLQLMLKLRERGKEEFLFEVMQGNYSFFIEYFKYIKKNSIAFGVLLNYKSETNFTSRFSQAIAITRNETDNLWYKNDNSKQTQTLLQYWDAILSSIYVSMINTWLQRGMDLSEQEMGRMLTLVWRMLILKL